MRVKQCHMAESQKARRQKEREVEANVDKRKLKIQIKKINYMFNDLPIWNKIDI